MGCEPEEIIHGERDILRLKLVDQLALVIFLFAHGRPMQQTTGSVKHTHIAPAVRAGAAGVCRRARVTR